mgnify:CR=1 FL=1
MNKRIKNNKGVTLVALIVTIIVLIILAGISINLVLGDNGIITIAKKAKENTELAKIEEEKSLNELYDELIREGISAGNPEYSAIAKLAEFKTAIANAIEETGGVKPEITAETSVFADNIKGILKEVTKNATATADNISEGKTAWVNGELITGTGKDNETNYNDGSKNARLKKVKIGSCTSTKTFTITDYSGWESFTIDNFAIEIVDAHGSIWYSGRADSGSVGSGTLKFSKAYNNTTGTLTVTASGNTTLYVTAYGETNSDATYGANVDVYLYYVE